VTVYDARAVNREIPQSAGDGTLTREPYQETNLFEGLVDVSPQPIAMMRSEMLRETEMVVLVIDAAGKVRSAKMAGGEADPQLLEDAKAWKFIPAFKDGHAVACRMKMIITPQL
jgi:hypothetical protein